MKQSVFQIFKKSQLSEFSPDGRENPFIFSLKIKDLEYQREQCLKKAKCDASNQQNFKAINLRTLNLRLFSKNKLSLHKLQNL